MTVTIRPYEFMRLACRGTDAIAWWLLSLL
jgi:hypothetical protein